MADFPMEICLTIALWAELFFYGIYTTLLGSVFSVLVKDTCRGARHVSRLIYLWTTMTMFVVATLHVGVALYRFLQAYIFVVDPVGGNSYMFDLTRTDSFWDSSLFCVMTWLGDALVIYRCFHVWNRMCCIIIIPTLMLIASIVLNIVILAWYTHGPESPDFPGNKFRFLTLPGGVVGSIFPLGVVQNVITTGLIALKIWRQHRSSLAHGIVDRSSSLSLFRILRIIVESAMIYTLQNITLTVLHFLNHPAQFILQHVMVPSVGIVFTLISIRVHMARSNTGLSAGFNTFLHENDDVDSVIEFRANASPSPDVVSFQISQDTTDFNHKRGTTQSESYDNLQTLKSHSMSS